MKAPAGAGDGGRLLLVAVLTVLGGACDRCPGAGASPASSGSAAASVEATAGSSAAAPTSPPTAASGKVGGPGAMPRSFASLVRVAKPAVVTLKAWVKRENIFGHEVPSREGIGTAFVHNADGYLLTNNHVIENADEIVVSFDDDRELEATVVGRDKPTDLAVLKVDAKGLPALPLGDSDAIEVGDWVVAIGNPFGLEHTVSAGILSGRGRTRDDVRGLDRRGYFNFLQTDASINPGNSGGPLLNLHGQVVGINTAVRAGANNIGFAIPINMVRQLLPMLLRDGQIRRSQIGVIVEPLSGADAARLGRPVRRGALVRDVVPGGPADRAGLARDDVILAFDGKPVADPNELRWLASIAGVNRTVTLRVARGRREFDMRLTLSELSSGR